MEPACIFAQRTIDLGNGKIQQMLEVCPKSDVLSRFILWAESKETNEKIAQDLIEKHINNLVKDLEELNERHKGILE